MAFLVLSQITPQSHSSFPFAGEHIIPVRSSPAFWGIGGTPRGASRNRQYRRQVAPIPFLFRRKYSFLSRFTVPGVCHPFTPHLWGYHIGTPVVI